MLINDLRNIRGYLGNGLATWFSRDAGKWVRIVRLVEIGLWLGDHQGYWSPVIGDDYLSFGWLSLMVCLVEEKWLWLMPVS